MFYDLALVRFECVAKYANACKRKNKMTVKGDSIVNSVRYLTADFTKNKILLNMNLSMFYRVLSRNYCMCMSLQFCRLVNK